MKMSGEKSHFSAQYCPMTDNIPLKYRLASGLTPCLMFTMTGIVGYGTSNVLPEVTEHANAAIMYGMIALLIQVVSALASPLAGNLGDIFGRKILVVICLVLFTISSVFIGLANNAVILCIAVLTMSMSFSICQTSTSAMLYDAVSGKLLSMLTGLRHSAGQAAFLFGPIAAGILVTMTGVTKAYMFMALTGVASLILVINFTPNIKNEYKSSKIDWQGIVFLTGAVGSVSFLMGMGGERFSWLSLTSIVLILVCIVCSIMLYKIEKKTEKPVLDLTIFQCKEMVTILIYKLLMNTSNGVFGAYLILYCQEVMQMSSVKTGMLGLSRIAAIAGSVYVGAWTARKKEIMVSVHLATIMSLVSGVILLFICPSMPFIFLMLSNILMALNTSFGTIPLTLIPAAVLPKEKVGSGFGIFYFFENLGSVVGTAAAALLLNLVGHGSIEVSFKYIAASFVIFTLIRLIYSIIKFPVLKEVIPKL